MKTVVLGCVLAIGCGVDNTGPDDPPIDPPSMDEFPPPADGVQITSGPIDVGAGEEKTLCVILDLPSDTDLPIVKMEQRNQGTAHHFILFKAGSTLDPGVGDCPGGLFTQHPPIYPGTRDQGAFEMPAGVAITVPAKQTMILQLHLLNPSDAPITEEMKINLHAGPPGDYQKAGLVAASNYTFRIPPNSMYTATQRCYVPTAMNVFALTSHSHARTLSVDIDADAPNGPTSIFHNTSWSEPEFGKFSPALELGGFDWLELSCTWFNETSNEITYGETANDEMCMMFGYFYPATLDATPCLGI